MKITKIETFQIETPHAVLVPFSMWRVWQEVPRTFFVCLRWQLAITSIIRVIRIICENPRFRLTTENQQLS